MESVCCSTHHLFIFVVIVVLIEVYICLIKEGVVVVVVFKFANIIVNCVVVLDMSWLIIIYCSCGE